MRIVDQPLLNSFKSPGFCCHCGKKVKSRDPHHLRSRGVGGGNRLDIPLNIISLCSTFSGGDNCHQQYHDGKIKPEVLMQLVADREQMPLFILEGLLNWFQRAPKDSIERVCVTGGRDFALASILNKVLDELHKVHKFTLLIHGAARGADTLADEWAKARGIERQPFPADWMGDGPKLAGPIRNSRMIAVGKPQLVVAFPGASGTHDCVSKAVRAGIDVFEVESGEVKEGDLIQGKLF
jgi:hypothetical protein